MTNAHDIDFDYKPTPDPWTAKLDEEPKPARSTFPTHVLPPAVREMVERGARSQGVDTSYWGVPVLGVLSGAVGVTRRIQPKPDWVEVPILWTGLVAETGAGKSAGLRKLLVPIRVHDERLEQRSAELRQEYEQAKASRKKGEEPVEEPPHLAHLVDDATLEAMAALLRDNPRGLLMARDELSGWVASFDKYRSADDNERWLQIYNAEPIKVNRRTSGSIYVPRPGVAVTGTIQPHTAQKVFGTQDSLKSGLAARMLLAQPPVVVPEWSEEAIPARVKENYAHTIGKLLRLDVRDGDEDVLALDFEALDLFKPFWVDNTQRWHASVSDGRSDAAGLLSKLRGTSVRLALNLALARAAEVGQPGSLAEVDAEAMSAGIELVRWFEQEALQIYAVWERSTPQARASLDSRILELLRQRDYGRTELRWALKGSYTPAEIGESLARLDAAGLIEKRPPKPTGKPGPVPEIWGVPR